MDLHKLKMDQVRGFDAGKLRETEEDVRRELHTIRMDIYSAKAQHAAKSRGLKKALARVLTARTQATVKLPKAQGHKSAAVNKSS